jgi:lipopolysaccharide assembly outer membrane protein LptD (OstA)
MIRLLQICLTIPAILLIGLATAYGEAVDITADEITRNVDGVVIASGNVVIKRETDTLMADQVIYRPKEHVLEAHGHVIIKSDKSTIHAEQASMDTEDKTGSMQKVTIILPGGERLIAERVKRIDEHTFEAEDIIFSSCPIDQESWRIAAKRALLNQNDATLTTEHSRFEIWQIPVLYTPWWQQPLKRKAGLLMPIVGSGKRRGTEISLPVYIAPAANWDATLTPHWMSARGIMGEAEFRHISNLGIEHLNVAAIRDTVTNSSRSRLEGETHWQLPADISLDALADHVSDHDYLADFTSGTDASARYLQSMATLSQSGRVGEFEGAWSMLVRHQQNMLLTSNATTLQILPRLESQALWSAHQNLNLHFEQQTTRFDRRTGLQGWRMDLHPYIEVPWELAGGGITATLQAGSHHTRYWLSQTALANTQPTRTTAEASLEVRSDFERIDDQRSWRHVVSPILRYDFIDAPNQAALPNFDSGFGQLTWNNLLSGNRFSGRDRIERTNRISFLLENRLQYKPDSESPAHRDVLIIRGGVAYDLLQQSVDTALQAAPTRPFSDLLGEIIIQPIDGMRLYASGQYNPTQRYWATITSAADFSSSDGYSLHVGHQFTDARYAAQSQLLSVSGSVHIANRWHITGDWQYDSLLKLSQRTALGLAYNHPCWSLGVEAYRLNRPSGTSTSSNYGFRILLDFKGLGSVGS